uniref:Peptidase aspartic putative domain-containing protein n=1 Tax=Anopheles stephensi TaxID=30069 RepID=A0A182YSL7_ANOST
MDFLIIDKVIADLPAHDVCIRGWNISSKIVLADPQFFKSSPIDIILGARHYASFFANLRQDDTSPDLPSMMNSVFGYVIIDSCRPTPPDPLTDCTAFSNAVCRVSLEQSLERFWKLEERYETFYKETTQRDDLGRYIVRLPRSPDFNEKLGVLKAAALRRFQLLERRLERDPQLKSAYTTISCRSI